jgi:hypothetical protein
MSNPHPVLSPRWGTYKAASVYSGVSQALLRNWVRDGLLTRYCPAGRGRVLIDLEELDQLIRSGAGQVPSRGANLNKAVRHAQ